MTSIAVLVENTSQGNPVRAEHGLSLLVEHGPVRVLFDTGASAMFLENAHVMDCAVKPVAFVVLSHGHYDHTGGLAAALTLLREQETLPEVVFHPDALLRRRRRIEATAEAMDSPAYKDLSMPERTLPLLDAFPLREAVAPFWLADDMVFLGEIPRPHPETSALLGEIEREGGYEPDMLNDDSALVCVTPRGLNIIVGCAHAGIINTVLHAKAVTGVTKVNALVGGLHTGGVSSEVRETVARFLAAEAIPHLYACHCSGNFLAERGIGVSLSGGDRLTL